MRRFRRNDQAEIPKSQVCKNQILKVFLPTRTKIDVSRWIFYLFSKIRILHEAEKTYYPFLARKHGWRGGKPAAIARHYFFPCPTEFLDEIQRLAHVQKRVSRASALVLASHNTAERRGDDLHRFCKNRCFRIFSNLDFFIFAQKKSTFSKEILYKIDGQDPTSEICIMVQKISGRVAALHSFGPPDLLDANFLAC